MKLKWYDWDGVGEIPLGVVGVRMRNNREFYPKKHYSGSWFHSEASTDIIAYTLGEELGMDDE